MICKKEERERESTFKSFHMIQCSRGAQDWLWSNFFGTQQPNIRFPLYILGPPWYGVDPPILRWNPLCFCKSSHFLPNFVYIHKIYQLNYNVEFDENQSCDTKSTLFSTIKLLAETQRPFSPPHPSWPWPSSININYNNLLRYYNYFSIHQSIIQD